MVVQANDILIRATYNLSHVSLLSLILGLALMHTSLGLKRILRKILETRSEVSVHMLS
jgi:hypothetical protein